VPCADSATLTRPVRPTWRNVGSVRRRPRLADAGRPAHLRALTRAEPKHVGAFDDVDEEDEDDPLAYPDSTALVA
jgi:hypothetical protein